MLKRRLLARWRWRMVSATPSPVIRSVALGEKRLVFDSSRALGRQSTGRHRTVRTAPLFWIFWSSWVRTCTVCYRRVTFCLWFVTFNTSIWKKNSLRNSFVRGNIFDILVAIVSQLTCVLHWESVAGWGKIERFPLERTFFLFFGQGHFIIGELLFQPICVPFSFGLCVDHFSRPPPPVSEMCWDKIALWWQGITSSLRIS